MFWVRSARVGYKLFKEIGHDDLSGGASELAYKFFLALFPFLIFLAALGGFVSSALHIDNPTDQVMNLIGDSLPPDATSLLRTQVNSVVNSHSAALLSFGIVGAIWAASSGMGSVIKVINRIYKVKEDRSLPVRYALAVGLTLLAGGFLIGALIIMLAGQLYGAQIAGRIGFSHQSEFIFTYGRWIIAILLLLAAVAFLLWAAPNVEVPFRWVSPGAILFVGIWLPGTYLFGLYVANFGSYDATYGALGGVVILLFYLYLTSLILLMAAALNAVLEEEEVPQDLEGKSNLVDDNHDAPTLVERAIGRHRQPAAVHGPPAVASWIAGGVLALISRATFSKPKHRS